MSRNKPYLALAGVLFSILGNSCIYDDLPPCDGDYYGDVTIENDWREAPEANPEGMAYLFYPAGGTDPWRFDIPGRDGARIKIPTGDYSLLVFNDDTSNIILNDETGYSGAEITTAKGQLIPGSGECGVQDPALGGAEGQTVRLAPDALWAYGADNVKVDLDRKKNLITTFPRLITPRYHLEVREVVNIGGVKYVAGAVSGMAESMEMPSGVPSAGAAVNPFSVGLNAGKNGFSTEFSTFGRASDTSLRNFIYLLVTLKDGQKKIYEFDVTDIILGSPDPMDVWIVIDRLELPESGDEAGSFDVNVDGWSVIRIDIQS